MSLRACFSFLTPSSFLPVWQSFPPSMRSVLADAAFEADACFTISWSNCFSSALHCCAGVIEAPKAAVDRNAAVTAAPIRGRAIITGSLISLVWLTQSGGGTALHRTCVLNDVAAVRWLLCIGRCCNGPMSAKHHCVAVRYRPGFCYNL